MLSDMEPALSPLPPSPDREGLGDSSISEEESGSGSSSEDDGSENEDEDSDYSLGDLADMLIGEHGENLAASTMKTRSSDQDVHEDVENSSGGETKTKNDVDCAKTENESSARQSLNEGNAPDVEFSENLYLVNCDVANTENEISKALKMSQESTDIEAEMNENLHIVESDSSDRKKTDDESAKTKEPSNAEKCTVVTPSPQRKAKQRMASPKPRVMTRSRAKAMKLSSSSDAESSSERESGMEVIQTQEPSAEVSDTGLKRNSNATDIGKSNDGGSGSNEQVSSDALVDNKNEFTESSQAKESQAHVEGFLSDSSSCDADDVAHHHGNLFEAVCSKTSLADLQDQEPTEDTSNVLLVGVEADVLNYKRNDGQLSCSGTLLTNEEEQVGNEDNSDTLVGMDANAIHLQRNDSDINCSGALLTDSEKQVGNEEKQKNDSDVSCSDVLLTNSEKQAGNEDNSNTVVGMDTNAIHQQRQDSDVSCSDVLLTDSEKQAGNEDNLNVLTVGMDADTINQQRNDSDVNCSGALHTDSEKQAVNENHSDVFTGGQEVNGSRHGHSTGLLSEQVTIEDSSDETSEPVSKVAANISTEVEIDLEQQFSSTSESGSEIKSSASLNMTREESSNITEIPSLQLNNENSTTVLDEVITEKSTEETSQDNNFATSQDNKITADANGTTLLLQSETKENTFHRGEDTLEENNNDVSEDFEASHEQVGSALVVDADSCDQTQPFVPKNYNQSTCTTEIKTSNGSEVSSTCDGAKKEHILKEQLYISSDEESDVDSFPCVVPGKVPKSAETSKSEPADVSSSTVEVDVNQSTVTCEKETTIPTTSTTETTQCSSIKSDEVESSKDSNLSLEEGGHSHTSDEAMQSCSTDEHKRKDSKGQDSSVTENIPVLTSESSLKDSELEKGESFFSDGEQFSTCNDERKNSDFVKVKDVLASKPVTEEANEPSTSNDGRNNSDLVKVIKDVPASKTVIEDANEPSTSNNGSKNSDLVKVNINVPASKTVIEEPSTSSDGRKNSDLAKVKDVLASKTVTEEANEPSTSTDGRKNSDLVKVNIDVPASKTVIEDANEPSTSNNGRKNSDFVKVNDVPTSKTVNEEANESSTSKKRHFVKKKDLSSRNTSNERSSTVHEGRKNSDMGRAVSLTAICKEGSSAINDEKRHFDNKADLSSRNTSNERSSVVHEGRKRSVMGKDVSVTATRKESCSVLSDGEKNSTLGRDVSSRAVSNESCSIFNVGRRNSDLGKHVCPRIITKEGSSSSKEKRNYSECEKEVLPCIREPSTFIKERKPCVVKRDVSSARTVAEKAGIRKGLSPPQLDVNESKLEEGGTSLELPWSPNDAGPSDDFPAACDPTDDSPIQISFNNLECLLEEFPALSPLPPSPCPSDDEECSTSLISSNNLNKESSNRVTDLTSTKKTFDAPGKPEFRRGRTLNYTEVASRTVKRASLENTATMYVTESNKVNISATPRNRVAKEKANESASTPCSRRNALMKRSLQRPVSASPCAAEIISLKRSYQQSVCEPVDKTDAVSQKSKKMKTQPNIPDKKQTSSLEKRLDMSTIPVKKATFSQPSKKNGATKGSILVDGKGPILAGRKNPKPAGNKEPIRATKKGPILVGDKEPILVGADGPILESNEEPVLEEKSKNPNNSAKVTCAKQGRYRPFSIRPGYMPEVKYVFKCLSRVHEDNVDLHVVVARLTTKRCISSSTPVASAIIQFLKEREDDLIPLILDQLERFKTDGSLNNWQPVISSFESRLLEVVSLLSSDTLFGNLIPRLVSLCSRSLTEARCNSNDEEVMKGELSLW